MKLRDYLKLGIIGSVVLAIILAISLVFLTKTTQKANDVLNTRNEISVLVANLESASSYLTNEARLYAFTQDNMHLNNYNKKSEEDLFTKAEEQLVRLGVPENIAHQLSDINEASLVAADHELAAFEQMKAGNLEGAQRTLFSQQYANDAAQVDMYYTEFKESVELWSADEASAAERSTVISVIIIVVAITLFIFAVIAILLLINRKVKPLFRLTENAELIANGDLTVEAVHVTANDEIGTLTTSFNTMVNKLRSILMTVNHSSVEVAASSEELLANSEQTATISNQVSASIDDISTKATQQQAQMDENAAALNEVTIGIQQVASAAEDVSDASNEAKERARVGQESLMTTTEQMDEIKAAVDETIVAIGELSKQSQEIEEFVTAITDISAQTNLLSLNAAIEAARAGEAGKGFAVVADEVRKLAEQSNNSASRITDIIQSLQSKIQQTTAYMQQVTARVNNGVEAVQSTGRSFDGIMQSTTTVSDQITGVSAIAQQMAASAEQMTAIFENLQAIAQETSTNSTQSVSLVKAQYEAVQEITASSNMLANLAEGLNSEVAKFKL